MALKFKLKIAVISKNYVLLTQYYQFNIIRKKMIFTADVYFFIFLLVIRKF